MKKFTSANYVYMFPRVFRRVGNGFLTTEHVYIICEADFFILWVPVHRFERFFFLTGLKFHIDFFSLY